MTAATLHQVATLMEQTHIGLFRLLFEPPHHTIPHIAQHITGTHNSFSHRFILTAVIDNDIAGIIILLPPQRPREDDVVAMLPWSALLRRAIVRIALAPLFHVDTTMMPYIQNICVAERFQWQGIGQQLITYAHMMPTYADINRLHMMYHETIPDHNDATSASVL
jgi:GNAT superfamily N-acetyltransferase